MTPAIGESTQMNKMTPGAVSDRLVGRQHCPLGLLAFGRPGGQALAQPVIAQNRQPLALAIGRRSTPRLPLQLSAHIILPIHACAGVHLAGCAGIRPDRVQDSATVQIWLVELFFAVPLMFFIAKVIDIRGGFGVPGTGESMPGVFWGALVVSVVCGFFFFRGLIRPRVVQGSWTPMVSADIGSVTIFGGNRAWKRRIRLPHQPSIVFAAGPSHRADPGRHGADDHQSRRQHLLLACRGHRRADHSRADGAGPRIGLVRLPIRPQTPRQSGRLARHVATQDWAGRSRGSPC